MTLSLGGLELIRSAGQSHAVAYGGLKETEFCRVAMLLYLFHEANHVSQNMTTFSDVQFLKRTAGLDRLGAMDLISDSVAAQIFSGLRSTFANSGRESYLANFARALEFMIEFCFPAFKFPISSRHKVQRAFGIILMLRRTRWAIERKSFELGTDAPLYPSFSADFSEVSVFEFPENNPYGVIRANYPLSVESTKELLSNIDCGDLSWILQRV
jgi:hypothetical protein